MYDGRNLDTELELFNFYQMVVEFDNAYKELVVRFSRTELRELLQHYIADLIPSKNDNIMHVHDAYVNFENRYDGILKMMYNKWGSGAPNIYKLLHISNGLFRNNYISQEYGKIITRNRIEE